MKNKTLIITGMHRSGTSLITNWLQRCGLQIGEQLLGAGLGNTEGHFEDIEFCRIHEDILRDNYLSASGIIDEAANHITPYHKARINAVINVKNSRFEQWGWKDPRTCLFLNIYAELLPDAYYLVILRDCHEVVKSLVNREIALVDEVYNTRKGYFSRWAWFNIRRKRFCEKFSHQHAAFYLKVWMRYNQNILDYILGLPVGKYLVVNYNQLLCQDTGVIDYLNNNWGFNLNKVSFATVLKKNMFSKSFNVENYISDNELIAQAKYLENRLQAMVGQLLGTPLPCHNA